MQRSRDSQPESASPGRAMLGAGARLRSWLALLLAWVAATAIAQTDVGQPSLTRYTPADTDANPYSFSVLALASGEIFVGNSDGVLRYFGQHWQRIGMPGAGAARSLALGADGRIYVGGYQHFGVLKRNADGRYLFSSLEPSFFPTSVGAPLGEVWDTVATKAGVYFATSKQIFYVGYDGARVTIELPGTLLTVFAPGGPPVVALRDHRLYKLEGTELREWIRASGRVRGLVRKAPERYWLLTDSARLYEVTGQESTRRTYAAESALRNATPYVMIDLPAGGYAVGALNGDIVRFNEELSSYSVWPTGTAPVLGLAVDRENHLWAATEIDIVRLSLSAAWSLIDRSLGLRGGVAHAAEYDGHLYVATSVGLLGVLRDATGAMRLETVALAQTEVNHLAVTPIGMLIAAREGVLLWRHDKLEPVVTDVLAWRLVPSKVIPDRYYVVEDTGLIVLDRDADHYRAGQRFDDPSFRFDEIAEGADGSLWVDRLLADPVRFPMSADGRTLAAPEPVALGAARDADRNAAILSIDGQPLVATERALLAWQDDHFVPLRAHPLISAGLMPAADVRARTCADGSVFVFNTRRLLRRDRDPAAAYVELRPMDGGTRGIVDVQCTSKNGLAWIGTWGGLVRFDPSAATATPERAAPVMERVRLVVDQAHARWLPLQPEESLLPHFRQIRLEYASPIISATLRYQSHLAGYESGWVDSGGEGYREFSVLPPGDYVFEARAVDETGVAGPALKYPFSVAAAWYETIWAMLVAAGALALLFVILLRQRSRTLERRNQELESLVSERTLALAQRSNELEHANKRLSELADLDGLTGVANRRKLEFELDSAWAAARASDAHLAMLLIDVDHFKQFNDTYGHALGDERLKAIAERLAGWVGPGELLARYGGEEFVLLMPGSSIDVALERAESIRRDARHAGHDGIKSSISIGIAERRKHQPIAPAQLFEYADLALYRAKNAGRDRVEVYTE